MYIERDKYMTGVRRWYQDKGPGAHDEGAACADIFSLPKKKQI
jgi:hypothetical protein